MKRFHRHRSEPIKYNLRFLCVDKRFSWTTITFSDDTHLLRNKFASVLFFLYKKTLID